MTKEEALKAMETHRVHHPLMDYDWVTKCTDSRYYNSDGDSANEYQIREELDSYDDWDNGWEVLPESERSVG